MADRIAMIDRPAADATHASVGAPATLVSILVLAAAVRVAYLVAALHTTGYAWEDPDGYVGQAMRLVGPDGWRWTFRAVTYVINGQQHALPPMYSVFLSVFAMFPGFPLSALVAQLLLSVASTFLIYALGRRIHSVRAGLIAAAAYAVWVPNIFAVWSTSQETLYVPLMLGAFLLLVRAMQQNTGWPGFALAGLAFGIAALTRSMPLFFTLPAAAAHVALAGDRRRASAQAAGFLAGFMLLTVPYSAALSRYFGQLTVIDTHGSIHVVSSGPSTRAPGLVETAGGLWRSFAADPATYVAQRLFLVRSLFHVNGGRILQIYVVAGSRIRAMVWKASVHAGSDLLFVASALLAPLGAVLCRQPRPALFLLLWICINIGIACVGGFSGARLRVPFEPMLLILAAAVCSGDWRRPRWAAVGLAAITSVLIALAVVPQVPQSLHAWPDYGVSWPSIFNRTEGRFTGAAGLSVPAYQGVAVLRATNSAATTTQFHVRVGGVVVETIQVAAGETGVIRALWPSRGLAFVELDATGPNGSLEGILVAVDGR